MCHQAFQIYCSEGEICDSMEGGQSLSSSQKRLCEVAEELQTTQSSYEHFR
jgi:hypothetical protein